MCLELNRLCSIILTVFFVGLLLIPVFITGCADEGDPVTKMVTGDDNETVEPVTEEPVVAPPPEPEEPKVSFKDEIKPILTARCALDGCHVAGGAANLDLTTYDAFKKGGVGGPAFVAGNGKGSLVVRRIDGGGMPPGGPPLNGDDIQLFVDWIDEGAENN